MIKHLGKITLGSLACLLLASAIQGSTQQIIKGKVMDEEGQPVPMAFVMVEGAEIGRSVDADGSFEIKDVDLAGSKFLLVSCEDYKSARVVMSPGHFLQVTLKRNFQYEVSVVAENSVSSEEQKGAVVTKMDTYVIPGTAADPILSAAVLPGIASHPDTSDLLVRGGAPDETGYFYDGFEILHPFQMESSQANYFSVFDNQIIDRFNVVNSGFEPRFGNCLSGVLDIRSSDEIHRRQGGLGLSIMGISGFYASPFGEKVGLILTGKMDFSDILGRVNGFVGTQYDNINQMGNLVYSGGVRSKLKLSWLYNGYHFDQHDEYASDSANFFLGLSFQTLWKNVLLSKISAAYVDYRNRFTIPFDSFTKEFNDRAPQFRWDNVLDLKGADLSFGMDFLRRSEAITVSGMEDPWHCAGGRWGFYLNGQFPLSTDLLAETGFRVSLQRVAGDSAAALDPRGSVAWTLGAHHVLRFSTGLYSQFGDLFDHAQFALQPKRSLHASLSYDYLADKSHVRVSLFDKEYSRLFLQESPQQISNHGRGFVRGLELYLVHEGGPFKIIGLYSYLHSKRREGDILQWAASSYAVPHSGLLVLSARVKTFQLSLRASYAAGLPFDPLAAVVQDTQTGLFSPEFGDANSEHLPHFLRLDINLNKNFRLGSRMVVFYCGVINATDRVNVQDVRFNAVSGILEPVRSIFKRSFFLGLYVPFN